MPERLHAERRFRQANRVAGRAASVSCPHEVPHGLVGDPGPLVRRGKLEQDLGALGDAGRAAFLDDLQCAEVERARIVVSEARGGLPGRAERVLERVLMCLRPRGQQMRRDLGRGT